MPIATPFIDLADAIMADTHAVGGPDMGSAARDALASYIQGLVANCSRGVLADMVAAARIGPYSIKGRYARRHIRENIAIPMPLNLVERYLLRRAEVILADSDAYEALRLAAPLDVAPGYEGSLWDTGGGII